MKPAHVDKERPQVNKGAAERTSFRLRLKNLVTVGSFSNGTASV